MIPDKFAGYIAGICLHCRLVPERPLVWTIIANPRAGGFSIGSRWRIHEAALKSRTEQARFRPPRADAAPSRLAGILEPGTLGGKGCILTGGRGHAGRITEALISEASRTASGAGKGGRPFNLIITAGGDGTSLEVLKALYHAPPAIREDFAVLRLPMGTGNDGADSWELGTALDLLVYPSVLEKTRALRLSAASSKGPFYAFNILSIGLDAFVTHMTNRMKDRFPGDSYKLWVDIAALLYDRIYKVGILTVQAFDGSGQTVLSFTDKLLLLAVGLSGRRTYGAHKRILPDERNVCAVRQMPLLRKLALKGLFTTGEHAGKPETRLFSAHGVRFSAENPILAQMDGETVLLERGDFPAVIEITEPAVNILKRAEDGPGAEN
ncbi:MAG: diacylglycerol kinase [Treponema sp.]|jgi:diacylglycerol kinase family enzyme|nr:diacylglycerol kinase [Treponema sp.]